MRAVINNCYELLSRAIKNVFWIDYRLKRRSVNLKFKSICSKLTVQILLPIFWNPYRKYPSSPKFIGTLPIICGCCCWKVPCMYILSSEACLALGCIVLTLLLWLWQGGVVWEQSRELWDIFKWWLGEQLCEKLGFTSTL